MSRYRTTISLFDVVVGALVSAATLVLLNLLLGSQDWDSVRSLAIGYVGGQASILWTATRRGERVSA